MERYGANRCFLLPCTTDKLKLKKESFLKTHPYYSEIESPS